MRLFCQKCGSEHDLTIPRWQCNCGGVLQLETETFFTKKNLQNRTPNLWRYREALPLLEKEHVVSFSEGFTPCIKFTKNASLKLDFLFPTGSFKDRGSSVLISQLKKWGINAFVEDSSGNAACSLAAYAAKAKMQPTIIVPSSCSKKKIMQIENYGAKIIFCSSRYDAQKKALEMADSMFYGSHVWNPYFFQGTKTIAFEIWEQTNGQLPEIIFAPAGNGTLLLGLYYGFSELQKFDFIGSIPRLIAVQAENCAPLVNLSSSYSSKTIAEGIAISKPLRREEMLDALQKTNGQAITVSENEIIAALKKLANIGLYVEPTAAVGFAGMMKSECYNHHSSMVILTGTGLKS